MLTLLAAQLGDGNTSEVIDVAKALEITHLARCITTTSWTARPPSWRAGGACRVGQHIAILTGDILFSRASQLMSRLGERAIRLQADTFERLVLGQMHETLGPQQDDDPIAFYIQVLADKTGSLIAGRHAGGGDLLQRAERVRGAAAHVRREDRRRVPAARRCDRPVGQARRDRKVPGTDLRAGVPTMPYLLLKAEPDDAAVDLAARIDDGVALIADGADPAILDGPLDELRDHRVTQKTLELAHAWTRDAVDALAPLPRGDRARGR